MKQHSMKAELGKKKRLTISEKQRKEGRHVTFAQNDENDMLNGTNCGLKLNSDNRNRVLHSDL